MSDSDDSTDRASAREPIELPPYQAVLVVDAKEFGSNTDVGQALLADAIPDVLTLAFDRAGLAKVWQEALFPHNTGDGLGVGFDTRHLPAVVSRLFDTLQDVLVERDQRLRTQGRNVRLRMRASLNVGPVQEPDPSGRTAVVGSTVITTHRLLDAKVVRDLLTRPRLYVAPQQLRRVDTANTNHVHERHPKSQALTRKGSLSRARATSESNRGQPGGASRASRGQYNAAAFSHLSSRTWMYG